MSEDRLFDVPPRAADDGLVIFLACACGFLWWLKARCRCPYCGATYATTAAVVRHVKRSHLS